MAIPGNRFTDPPVPAAFLPPLDGTYLPLSMQAPGGVAINDGSQGREVQTWSVGYDGINIIVNDQAGTQQYQLAVDGVKSVCLAFDSNMAVAFAYMTSEGGFLYFYNGLTNEYETIAFPDVTSCRIAVDKTADFFSGASDVVFAYVDGGTSARYRYQRDRYAIEYTVAPAPDIGLLNPLIRFGPSDANRLQFEFYVAPPPPPPPPPLAPFYQAIKPSLSLQRVIEIESNFD